MVLVVDLVNMLQLNMLANIHQITSGTNLPTCLRLGSCSYVKVRNLRTLPPHPTSEVGGDYLHPAATSDATWNHLPRPQHHLGITNVKHQTNGGNVKSIYDRRYRGVIARLQSVRRDHGLTQAQLAHTVGWARTTLSKVERCDRRLDLLETHMLASALGLRLSDLEPLLEGGTDVTQAQ